MWEERFGIVVQELGLGVQLRGARLLARRVQVTPAVLGALETTSSGAPRAREVAPSTRTSTAVALASAQTIALTSMTSFLKVQLLEEQLLKRPEFQSLGLSVVRDRGAADLAVEIDRPVFTFTFTFSVTDPRTSVVVASGKVIAWDGNLAAPQIAKELLRRIKATRE